MQLFEAIVPVAEQHQNFQQMLAEGNGYKMTVLQDWARGFWDRDGKFVREFQTTFDPCFWELYVHAVLKVYGFRPDFSKAAPDFILTEQGFAIEAVTATNAANKPPETQKTVANIPRTFSEFNREAIIRCSNSLISKYRKYQASYAHLPHVAGKPFVLGFASFCQPHSYMEVQRAIEAVLHAHYVDEDAYSGRPGTRLKGDELRQVFKDNGSEIELGLFESDSFKEISAVIFNSTATMGKVDALSSDPNPLMVFTAQRQNSSSPFATVIKQTKQQYAEHLLDGLRIYHNPYATHPLDPAVFRNDRVFQTFVENGRPVCEQRNGNLLYRTVFAFRVKKDS